ncbi:winged helix-turn-helix domain-containing protein [Undibacterium sp. RuTC16W]|uniref:winged helix-turn-helix domain-containing protein n=1 Tax=Undibacterium sp. RuTC16W TaxID=3413048 RepID=UPI003BF15D06
MSSQLDGRIARLLMYLAHRPGEVVSIDELLDQVWEGVVVSPDSVYQAIATLRKALSDDQKNPSYIITVPRRGYKLIASVRNMSSGKESEIDTPLLSPESTNMPVVYPIKSPTARISVLIALVVVVAGAFVTYRGWEGVAQSNSRGTAISVQPVHSIAVLPFLDLTDSMTEEPFADGMVEELINKLTKATRLPVTPAADSFFYKDKQVATEEVARALHVDYVLEGSVRKSGKILRIAVRLTRAADHFVIWSETYDRSWSDKLVVQDEIASEVSRSLAKSLN